MANDTTPEDGEQPSPAVAETTTPLDELHHEYQGARDDHSHG